ncbi:MAG: hypothetical protein IMW90_20225 [Thermogemmatispora sp.]|jgi:hypothetical protein|uniref:hypothetical protein n=1 Tax=Thermogemmatispora sp. TaxID=1968838 RepID=UPI001A07735D|nr:hypothetical protein [Thermogemmatispora sp.]MBE3568050.1 hypothetical protein [Thermogemmatispora sp.]
MRDPTSSFQPSEHLIRIGSSGKEKEYLPVQWRLVWFRESCPQGTIETEILHLDLEQETEEEYLAYNSETRRTERRVRRAKGFVICRAIVKDGKGGMATGMKSEKAASFPDFIEKAETGAIGRALAALGFGTQFAPELDEEHRIVDSPVERRSSRDSIPPLQARAVPSAIQPTDKREGPITAGQRNLISKLASEQGIKLPSLDGWSAAQAEAAIERLQRRRAGSISQR